MSAMDKTRQRFDPRFLIGMLTVSTSPVRRSYTYKFVFGIDKGEIFEVIYRSICQAMEELVITKWIIASI